MHFCYDHVAVNVFPLPLHTASVSDTPDTATHNVALNSDKTTQSTEQQPLQQQPL